MSFIYAGAAAIMVGSAAYIGEQNRKGASKQADATRKAADEQAKAAREIAAQQQRQAEESLAFQKQQEAQRQAAQRQQLAAAEAEQRRQAADAANSGLTVDEPTVQLAATSGANDTLQRKQRRAAFRPEYASGVSI